MSTTTRSRNHHTARMTTVTADCILCGATKQVKGNAENWRLWKAGELSSDVAFRTLKAELRRWLLNGICPDHNLDQP